MIVRISGEGQYRLADEEAGRLNELENAVVAAVEQRREEAYPEAIRVLVDYVRSGGTPLAEDDLEHSDLILPPADLTFQEAASEFTGEGLIPD